MIPSALRFTGTTDIVKLPSGVANHTQASAFTVCLWAQWDAFVAAAAFYSKVGSVDNGPRYRVTDTAGNIQVAMRRSPGAQDNYATNNVPLTLNRPHFVAVSYDDTDTRHLRIFAGSVLVPAAEATYGTAINGSGNWDDSSNLAAYGNSPTTTGAAPGRCQIFLIAEYPARLTLAQIQAVQQGHDPMRATWKHVPTRTSGGRVMDLAGTGAFGTITGALPVSNVLPRVRA